MLRELPIKQSQDIGNMIELKPTTHEDFPQIQEWIDADPYHRDDPDWTPESLLTGHGELTFCLVDDQGPLCFVRLNSEGERLRLSTQFGPEEEVSKKRLVTGLLSKGIPAIIKFGQDKGFKGIVFESFSPTLISFMEKQNFMLDKDNDYILRFNLE